MKIIAPLPVVIACAALLGASLSGCMVATVAHPIGRPATPEDVPKLDGHWQHQDHAAYVKLLDDGTVRVAALQWDPEKQDFVREDHTFLLTTHDEALYLMNEFRSDSAPRDAARDEPRHYTFTRVLQPDDDSLVLVPANPAAFRDAVEDGAIAGTIHDGRSGNDEATDAPSAFRGTWVELEADAEAIRAFITPDRIGEQFRIEHAIVLQRRGPLPTSDEEYENPIEDGAEQEPLSTSDRLLPPLLQSTHAR